MTEISCQWPFTKRCRRSCGWLDRWYWEEVESKPLFWLTRVTKAWSELRPGCERKYGGREWTSKWRRRCASPLSGAVLVTPVRLWGPEPNQTCKVNPAAWGTLERNFGWSPWHIKWWTFPSSGRLLFPMDGGDYFEENRRPACGQIYGGLLQDTWPTGDCAQWYGPPFASQQFKAFLEYSGIEDKKGVPYWPQSNGEVERVDETILKIVRIARLEGADWRKAVQDFLFQYRVTPRTVTGVSPAELLKLREREMLVRKYDKTRQNSRNKIQWL